MMPALPIESGRFPDAPERRAYVRLAFFLRQSDLVLPGGITGALYICALVDAALA